MARIKQLSKNLINKIAAGEVIERPASVVKELVENSIDADASKIEISISNECRNIRIADNGSGIYPDDIDLAFSKHATSKLKDEDSLFNINTLGFRGEALASIISISKVTCTTRTKDFDYGIKAQAENSTVKISQVGCAIGTIMEVNDLFYNQPARLKFLKNAKTEFGYIQELINSLALANPHIAFILKNNDNEIINTAPNSDLPARITQIYSSDILKELRKVEKEDLLSGFNISGYVSIPSYTRTSKKSIFTFVNSRYVKCPVILKAIDTAYKNMLPQGRYPLAVINLNINPNDIDVNVHPSKREVRYKNPNQIFNFIYSAVTYALNNIKQDFVLQEQNNSNSFDNKIIPITHTQNSNDDDFILVPEQPQKINFSSFINNNEETAITPNQINLNVQEEPRLNSINIIGQFKNTYILVENDDNLEIIDQHIAQERYIYEKLKNEKSPASQLLIVSDVLEVDIEDANILENAKPQLKKFGYQIENLSENKIIFKKIPQVLSHEKPKDILSELLKNLKNSADCDLDTIEEKILITTSCKASVKAGEKLTLWQMEDIVRKLRTTKNPYTCPHGRPISHYIPLKEVAAYFSRNT